MNDGAGHNTKRIAKNTLLLYVRTFFTLLINLYISRVVLDVLGVDDFGVYTVIGGVVAMFSILSSSLSAAIGRYITYELGRGDVSMLERVFSMAVNIQVVIGTVILLLAELAGVWFLNSEMNIPPGRMDAANWVLQCSVFTFLVNLLSVPYSAVVIAYERMDAFAYISMLEVVLKLVVAVSLYFCRMDRLVAYAVALLGVAVFIRLVYALYCRRRFRECRYRLFYDKGLFRQMVGFATWNFIGSSAGILKEQGVNVLLNLFCGTTVNAARGISMQVNSAVSAFTNNFVMAVNPQITKSYAAGDMDYAMKLVFQGARLSFYLLLLVSLPILMETRWILELWLNVVPDYTVVFVRLVLVCIMVDSISYTMITLMLATGNIRTYQLVVGGCQLLNFPLSYVALKVGCSPEYTLVIAIVLSCVCLFLRLFMLRRMVGLQVGLFLRKVLWNVCSVSVGAIVVPLWFSSWMEEGWGRFVAELFICMGATVLGIYYIGCSHAERVWVKEKVCERLKKGGNR